MTDEPTTRAGTPLWVPQPAAPQYPYQPPVQQQPQPYVPAAHRVVPPQQAPYATAFQGVVPPGPPPMAWQQNATYRVPTKVWQSSLPLRPSRYHEFLHTPRRRWWKLPVALIVAALTWLIASVIVSVPAMVYDILSRGISLTDPNALTDYVGTIATTMTPAFFLANNIGIALMIPCAWLGLIIYGQKPRWLSSVTGRLRWGWMLRLIGLIAIPYLILQSVEALLLGGLPDLSWKPYSIFMIVTVLLTTPLQCAGEEYGTRGLINRVLGSYGSRRVSFWIGAVLSSLVFMSLHVAADPYLNSFYFTFGMIACWMAWRTGGLEASIAMHVVNNVFAMVYLPFTDFSGMMDRSVGSASALDVAPILGVMLASVGIVEWQVRRRRPVAEAAPGAEDHPPGMQLIPAGAAMAPPQWQNGAS